MRLCRGLRLAVVVGLVGCGSDDFEYGSGQPGTASAASTTGGIAGSTGSSSASPATPQTSSTTGGQATTTRTTSPDGGSDSAGPGDGTGGVADCDHGGSVATPGGFEFIDKSTCDLVQLDRVGVPFVQRLLISSTDAYNAASPVDDQSLEFFGEILQAGGALHALLDDDIEALGLLPCALGACGAVLTPLVVPDALLLDLDRPSGFPNGRALPDPVFDRMLAAILLDADAHPITTLSSIPPSPADNDVQFYDEFLAAPH